MGPEPDRFAAPFAVGDFRVEPGLDRISRGTENVPLEPRAMDLLVCLARHAGETVSKETILAEVWHGAFVVEAVIPKTVSALRTALGDDAASPAYILTVPRRGYRLVAPVGDAAPPAGSPAEPPAPPRSAVAAPPAPPAPAKGGEPAPRRGRRVAGWLAALSIPLAAIAWLAKPWEGAGEGSPLAAGAELPDSIEKVLLEARHLWGKRSAESVERANELLLEAAKEAPRSAEVQGWLALSHVTRGNYLGSAAEQYDLAAERARLALELDPDSAIAECALGAVAICRDRDPEAAIRHQSRAVALDPDLVPARQFLAEALSVSGRHEEALATIDQAIRMEPLSALLHGVRGIVLQHQGRPLAALEAYDRVRVLEPRFGWVHRNRSWALARLGRGREAAEAIYQSVAAVGEEPQALAELRAAVDADGFAGYWRWQLGRLDWVRSQGWEVRPMIQAEALAGNGRFDEALVELRRAAEALDGEFFYFFRDSVAFDAIRDRSEFVELYASHGAR